MRDDEPRFPIRQLTPALSAALRGAGAYIPAGLAWRVKQVQRQDWPTTLAQDAQIKRGYTPRQTLRLLSALSLLDAGLGPTQAVATASDNENTLLAVMSGALAGRGAAGGRLVALLRPRAIDGPAGAEGGGSIFVEAITDDEAGSRMKAGGAGPAWLVLDLAGQLSALLERLDADPDAIEAFAAVTRDGARATLGGRGHVQTGHPRGDRYLTRKVAQTGR